MKNHNNWNITYHSRTKKQIKKLKSGDLCTARKVKMLIARIATNPFYYGDDFEPLYKFGKKCFSRKTSRGGRLVYAVNKTAQQILILSLSSHYGDNGSF